MRNYLTVVLLIFIASTLLGQVNKSLQEYKGNTSVINLNSFYEKQLLKNDVQFYAKSKLSTDLLGLVDNRFRNNNNLTDHVRSFQSIKAISISEKSSYTESDLLTANVYVYLYLTDGADFTETESVVHEFTDIDYKNNYAAVRVKVNELLNLAKLKSVKSIRTVLPPINNTGSVTTKGDTVHQTALVRALFSETGAGINVGIISNGVDSRATAQATGDLPADGSGLTVLSNTVGGEEGTAMLEVVHDMVPGSGLFFHDHGANQIAFNNGIDNLIAAGCQIICDDISWLAEPFYEDGTVGGHVASVVASQNIIYLTSAGNSGQRHYQGDFIPIAGQLIQHDFSGGSGGPYLYANIPANGQVIVVVQWDDQFGASGNNYDVGLYNLNLGAFVSSSTFIQDGDDDPREIIVYSAPAGPAHNYAVIVQKTDSTVADKNLEVFIYSSGGADNYSNNITPVDAIFGHASAVGSFGVAAVDVDSTDAIRGYSSQGPSTIAFPTPASRPTPAISGVDGVAVTGSGGFPNPFFGTSAAAPAVAAVAAQIWADTLGASAAEVRNMMTTWATDLGAPGFDNVFGSGLADALAVFNNVLPVELNSFSATIHKAGIHLNWSTSTEVNNFGFEIERKSVSTSNVQGNEEWKTIGFVKGSGNSNNLISYTYQDNSLSGGTKFNYRLKQIDNDGRFTFSDVIEVSTTINEFELKQNYPNPFNPETNIAFTLPSDSKVNLQIFNALGERVETLINGNLQSGVHTIKWNAASSKGNFSSGVYFYQIIITSNNKSFAETKKMILTK